MLCKAENSKALLLGINGLCFFGVGGAAFYGLSRKIKKKFQGQRKITIKQNRGKLIALLAACLAFLICSWLFLPFHHLFDGSHKYTPLLGYVIGITGILFSGLGVIGASGRLIYPETLLQISDAGLLIPKGKKQARLVAWHEIRSISSNENFLFLHLSSPNIRLRRDVRREKTVTVPIALLEFDIAELEVLIWEKIEAKRKETRLTDCNTDTEGSRQ